MLTLTNNLSGKTRELHYRADHEPLAASRGCVVSYSIYSIVYPLEIEGDPIAVISIYTQGFEGFDRRFIAVPVGSLQLSRHDTWYVRSAANVGFRAAASRS